MKQCKCEHWQQCPTCMPHRFDEEGNLKPPEPTPLQAARAEVEALKQRLFEMQNAAIDMAKQQFLTQEDIATRWGISGATLERDRTNRHKECKMNERIESLIELAEVWNTEGDVDKCEVDLYKFAELIVQETIKQMAIQMDKFGDDQSNNPAWYKSEEVVKKHFGVKE